MSTRSSPRRWRRKPASRSSRTSTAIPWASRAAGRRRSTACGSRTPARSQTRSSEAASRRPGMSRVGLSNPGSATGPNGGLVIRDLTVAYGRRVVLHGVSAEIRPGQVVGVVGPNGGGKSTLLMAVLGIVPIIGGHVTLFGQPASPLRARIAYVPQREAVDWAFPVTVREVVMMGRDPHLAWPRRPGGRDRQVV